MKWVLVAVVFGAGPVTTNLVYSSVSECLLAGDVFAGDHFAEMNKRMASSTIAPGPERERFQAGEASRIPKYSCVPQGQ